jgi:protein-S-isoprenylcysteine O-methyltransferase Ste14
MSGILGAVQQERTESGRLAVHTLTSIRLRPIRRWSAWLASPKARSSLIRLGAAVWFLLLTAASIHTISGQIATIAAGRTGLSDAWPTLLAQACVFSFYTIIFFIIILRPEPVSQAKGVGPMLLALVGTYGPWLLPLLPRGPELPSLAMATAAILLISEGLVIYSLLALGKSFSLAPQARGLVTTGPYAIVRNPLYLFEEAALASVLLQYAWYAALPFLALHVFVQIRRIQLEEKVLRRAFPDYALYARKTARLIPGVW